jgi:hypothetical protein
MTKPVMLEDESSEVVVETLNAKGGVNTWRIELESSSLDEPT